MTDRYLFRGKRKAAHDLGTWYIGNLCIWGDKYMITPANVEVYPATIGQCTGLKDLHGKLIFEGDILRHKTPYEVEWLLVVVVNMAHGLRFCTCDPANISNPRRHGQMVKADANGEVIGNIHDNPELLEGA
jgi:uncharacterized phage protein (TIGR01671 family)